MAAKITSRELAKVPSKEVPETLHSFIANAACEVFKKQEDVNSSPKDQVVLNDITNPLQWMLFGGDPSEGFDMFNNQSSSSNFCGKVFKNGEPAYFCK